jgi:ribosome-binding protein aMBF1 (putative translation factor)
VARWFDQFELASLCFAIPAAKCCIFDARERKAARARNNLGVVPVQTQCEQKSRHKSPESSAAQSVADLVRGVGNVIMGQASRSPGIRIVTSHSEAAEASVTSNQLEKIIGEKIRNIRIEKGVSQKELAFKAQIDFRDLNDYETGIRRTSARELLRLAKALGVSADYFFRAPG